MFFWQSISLALNWRRHAVTDEFCSMSIDRSMNDSSRDDTVSHVRHRVSLVSTPSNSRWMSVEWNCAALCDVDAAGCVDSVAMDALTTYVVCSVSPPSSR